MTNQTYRQGNPNNTIVGSHIKGVGDFASPHDNRWNLLSEDVSLPAVVIYQSKLENNILWMKKFAQKHEVSLAPHGKTTMAPAFFTRQVEAGAWGISVASATQAAAASLSSTKRVLMANQLVGRRNMEIVADLIDQIEFYCLVDSIENVHQLGTYFTQHGKTLNVLIEVGVMYGRCGCREDHQVFEINQTIAKYDCLKLAGLEVYEGVIHGDDAEEEIDQLLSRFVSLAEQLAEADAFDQERFILTGAGSAWYDLVSKHLQRAVKTLSIQPIIRPGCYLIHDKGIYQKAQDELISRLIGDEPEGKLESCLEIWTYVLSIPEPGLVIVAMGKRDVAFSDGLPKPSMHYRIGDTAPSDAHPDWKLEQLMDQHAFMRTTADADIKVGDIITFSTSHPCLTFDKWRDVCLVDDNFKVVECLSTYF